jgi:hypothetical protein
MATATTTSTKTTRSKPARKPARAKAAGTGRRTQSSATRAKASRTRARHEGEQVIRDTGRAARQVEVASRDTAQVVGDYAERAVLIPVGAALIARERIASTVGDTISTYSTPSRAQQQLRRFERRGLTARKRLEREVRKARVRVERQVRQRRRAIEHAVNDLEDRRDTIQERILNLV